MAPETQGLNSPPLSENRGVRGVSPLIKELARPGNCQMKVKVDISIHRIIYAIGFTLKLLLWPF